MSFAITPTHGKLGALYRLRPNGHSGVGLNDVTWGLLYSGTGSAYFEVQIDAESTPDTFQWRKDGGSWTTAIPVTGAAQTLSDGQTITFAATTGHALNDLWAIGNLDAEATTEVGSEAQITDEALRFLNPNNPPVFTDDGGETVLQIDYSSGKGIFGANVGNVTVDGNNGYIPSEALEKVGYVMDWSLSLSVDMADISRMGQSWKEGIPGLASGTGGCNAFFIGSKSFIDAFQAAADGTQSYFLLELFTWDQDQDETGDHFVVWVTFTGGSPSGNVGDTVKESASFQTHLIPALVEDS